MECTKQYLKFEEYKKLGGSLDQVPFNLLEAEARNNIDRYTFGRLKEIESPSQNLQYCMFKLITALESYNKYETQNKAISSENIDGYSVSYSGAGTANNLIQAKDNQIYKIIKTYLETTKTEDGTPLLFRGVE